MGRHCMWGTVHVPRYIHVDEELVTLVLPSRLSVPFNFRDMYSAHAFFLPQGSML
jgi:hypothetical protein